MVSEHLPKWVTISKKHFSFIFMYGTFISIFSFEICWYVSVNKCFWFQEYCQMGEKCCRNSNFMQCNGNTDEGVCDVCDDPCTQWIRPREVGLKCLQMTHITLIVLSLSVRDLLILRSNIYTVYLISIFIGFVNIYFNLKIFIAALFRTVWQQ